MNDVEKKDKFVWLEKVKDFIFKKRKISGGILESWAAVFIGIMIVAIFFLFMANRGHKNLIQEYKATTEDLIQTVKGQNLSLDKARRALNKGAISDKTVPLLVDWVYSNSSKISKKMAKEIVFHTSQTNDPLFLLAIMKKESVFDPTTISSKGAMGLGQVMPEHEEGLKQAGILKEMRDIFEISVGVKSTAWAWDLHLKEAGGDYKRALGKYLGESNKGYNEQILADFFYLRYLCKEE